MNGVIILMALLKEDHHSRSLSDLVKISFKDSNYLSNSGRNICTAPADCMEELLSAIQLVQVRNADLGLQDDPLQLRRSSYNVTGSEPEQAMKKTAAIKVGQLFYMRFYFTGQNIYYDHHENKLILSRQQRTAFKIIEHISRAANASKEQTYDYIGNVVPHEHRYLIVFANELLFLKHIDHSVYLGTYDQKCIVTFAPSIFRMDKPASETPLLRTPCRLYSVEQERYVVFDIQNNEAVLKEQAVCVQGMCSFEKLQLQLNEAESPTLPFHRKRSKIPEEDSQNNNVAIRVLQGNHKYFLTHHNSSTEKLTHDLARMLNPVEERLNTSNSFLIRFNPTFANLRPQTTFNLTDISNISMAGPLSLVEEEEKQEIIEELTLKEVNLKNIMARDKEQMCFLLEFYPSVNNQVQLFIYDAMTTRERIRGRQIVRQKQLYLDYRVVAASGKLQCVLKEYSNQKVRRESSKYKNILRVEYITREMLLPYTHYYSLLLNLKICNYFRQQSGIRSSDERSKLRLNLVEIKEVLEDFYASLKEMGENNKQRATCLIRELLDINLIRILEELLEAIIAKKQLQDRQELQSTFREREEDSSFQNIQSIQIIAKIILLIASFMPESLVSTLLHTQRSQLFIRICNFTEVSRFFAEIESICKGAEDGKKLLARLEEILKASQEQSPSRFRNICILWGCRVMKQYHIPSPMMESLSQRLVHHHKGVLTQDYIIMLELIKVAKGELFYSREVVRFLPLQRLQQEETSFPLRQAYFARIIANYKNVTRLPFLPKPGLPQQSLERDNQRILRNYLQQVLPKSNKFQTIENKLLAMQCCELYLYLGQNLLQDALVEEQPCREYLPLLITLLEQHLQHYPYQEEQCSQYVMRLLKCLQLALLKYVRLVLYEQSQLGVEDEETLLRNCLEQYHRITEKKATHAANRSSLEPPDRKNTVKDPMSKRATKRKVDEEVSRTSKILSFFSRRKQIYSPEITECIDRQMIWDQLNKKSHISSQHRLDLFQRVLAITVLLLSPVTIFRNAYQGLIANPVSFSSRLVSLLQMLVKKGHRHDLWQLVDRLGEDWNDEEWRTIVAVINHNKLLKSFILRQERQAPSERQLACLFRFLNELLIRYLEWTNSRIFVSRAYNKQSDEEYMQIDTDYHHFSNDLEPSHFLMLLGQVEPIYNTEEMTLHLTIMRAIGVITALPHYNFYSQYIIRYECQKYHTAIVQLSLTFLEALTSPLRTEFANNFQYSLFKQGQQLKEQVCALIGFREEQRNAPQRATNFNTLSELRDERVSRLSFTSEDKEKEFLIGLFRLLGQVEAFSTTHKEILLKLGYSVVAGVAGRFNGEILLRHEVLKFIVQSIEKQVSYGLNKQLKAGEVIEQPEDDEEDTEQYALLLDFVKHTNYLLQRETEALKGLDFSSQKSKIFFEYARTLLSMVRMRDNILKYLKFEGTEKIYRSDSNISSERSLPMKSITSQSQQSLSSSFQGSREDFRISTRARQLLHHYNSMQIDQSQVQNMEGINRLLCYQLLQALDEISKREELPMDLQKPLQWVENNYKISLTSQVALAADSLPQKKLLYKVDKSYLMPAAYKSGSKNIRITFIEDNTRMSKGKTSNHKSSKDKTKQEEDLPPTAPRYQAINSFLSLRVEGYLVLLIQLLQRQLLLEENGQGEKQINGQVVELMVLIQAELGQQIDLYRQEDREFGRQNFEVLPMEYYKRNGYEQEEEAARQTQQQRCCQLPVKKIEALFQLLLLVHRMDKPLYLLYLLTILERLAFYNVANQTTLQHIIATQFPQFYDFVLAVIYRFSILSPLAEDAFFTLPQGQGRGGAWVKGLRGMEGFHLASLNYYMLVKMLLACSRTLNFEFKSLFARPTIDHQAIVDELVTILEALLKNLQPPTEQKLEWIRVTLKLGNNLMRGPVEPIIQVVINRGYNKLLVRLLTAMNGLALDGTLRLYLLGIKRLIAEGLFILIPFMRVAQPEVECCEAELRDSYIRSKKAYHGEYVGIIGDYAQKKKRGEEALIYFQLALNFYYCLIEMYSQRGQRRIAEVQVELLARASRQKRRRRNWMVFYQIYEVLVAIINPFYRRARGTYEEMTDDRSQQQLLRRAILFFTRNVGQIEVRVYGKTKKVSFLLLQEASCYNVSIRKELHRLIGRQERELRLRKLMKVSKYIIIRLETSKIVRNTLSHFKPLEIIVTNRQLWKSLCFIGALLLNLIFIFYDSLNQINPTLFLDLRYLITAFTFLFIIFLFLIYFLEVLPLKLKVYSLLRGRGFRVKAVLMLFWDKTLMFALFYSICLGLSFFMADFVSLLLVDYLFRFKVSSKMTFLMFRSTAKIVGIVILTFTLLYVAALLSIKSEQRLDSCVDVASCTQDMFYVFMDLRFNVNLPYQTGSILYNIGMLPRLFLRIINMSLLVGIVFTEKRKDDQIAETQALDVRDVCFVCGGKRNAVEKARNSNRGFEQHVEMEHNLWNYVYYLVYLKNKERKNLNAIEAMILEQWHNNRIDWLPSHFEP